MGWENNFLKYLTNISNIRGFPSHIEAIILARVQFLHSWAECENAKIKKSKIQTKNSFIVFNWSSKRKVMRRGFKEKIENKNTQKAGVRDGG